MREKSSHSTASCLHIYVCIYEYKCTMHTYVHVCPRGSTYVVGPMWQGVVSLGDKPPSTGRHRVAGEREREGVRRCGHTASRPQKRRVGAAHARAATTTTHGAHGSSEPGQPASSEHHIKFVSAAAFYSIRSKINQLRISKWYEVNLF